MARKPPKPRRYDVVERRDLSRMFGNVTKMVSPKRIKVCWADEEKPRCTTENIKDIALVRRK